MNDMQEGAHAERVLDDVRSAVNSGALATPAIFVEGVRWNGAQDPDALEGVLRAALAG